MQVERPWGKLARDEAGELVAWQPLTGHCRDVAAVLAALVRLPGIRRRLAHLAGRPALTDRLLDRLAVLAYLHDCGKVNSGFQARCRIGAPMVGHIAPLAPLFGPEADEHWADKAFAALRGEHLLTWGDGVSDLFDVCLSHHGAPWDGGPIPAGQIRHWQTKDGYDPLAELAMLASAAAECYPVAFAEGGDPLPTACRFAHAFAGLVQLADWIASSAWQEAPAGGLQPAYVSDRLETIGLDAESWRARIADPAFVALFNFSPRPAQRQTVEASGPLVILESETGSGKTEAALARFARLFADGRVDGLFFALPTRSAAVQLYRRVSAMTARLWPAGSPPVVLAVPGYLDEAGAGALPAAAADVEARGPDSPPSGHWAAEHPKRYFAAPISVGTIDQALYATLKVRHAHLRGSLLMRHLLVVDEVHASDSYMRRLLEQLLSDHLAAGGEALLLSATLGSPARLGLLTAAGADQHPLSLAEASDLSYPAVTAAGGLCPVPVGGPPKIIEIETVPLLDEPRAIAGLAWDAAIAGAKVLVIRNSVAGAVAVQQELVRIAPVDAPELFRVEGRPTLHHGRFAREDRRLLDMAVEAAIGKARPPGGRVIVGTQTSEQSLDLDADFLITDLAPADVLLQRLGRLFRHLSEPDGTPRVRPSGFEWPRARVLVPRDGLAPLLAPRRPDGLSRHGLGNVYADLLVLEATRRLIAGHPTWEIPAMNRWLVEHSLHPEALDQLLASIPATERSAWSNHRARVSGQIFADASCAALGVLRRDLPFMDGRNRIEPDLRLASRLGATDFLLDLPPGTVGAFGRPVGRISVPDWLARGADPALFTVTGKTDGLRLDLEGRHLVYDALGLRAEAAANK